MTRNRITVLPLKSKLKSKSKLKTLNQKKNFIAKTSLLERLVSVHISFASVSYTLIYLPPLAG